MCCVLPSIFQSYLILFLLSTVILHCVICYKPLSQHKISWLIQQTQHNTWQLIDTERVVSIENLISLNRALQMNISHNISSFIQTIHKDTLWVKINWIELKCNPKSEVMYENTICWIRLINVVVWWYNIRFNEWLPSAANSRAPKSALLSVLTLQAEGSHSLNWISL